MNGIRLTICCVESDGVHDISSSTKIFGVDLADIAVVSNISEISDALFHTVPSIVYEDNMHRVVEELWKA